MKKLILPSLIILTLFFSSCLEDRILPSGDTTTILFEYDNYSSLSVSDAFNVEVVYDSIDPHVSVTVDVNLVPHLEVIQQDQNLVIGLQRGVYVKGSTLLNATVYAKKIPKKINASGASNILITDRYVSDDMSIELSGASKLEATIQSTSLYLNLSGASTASLAGESRLYLAECSGASTLRGYDLQVDQLIVDLSGASTGLFSVNESIIADASGASSIRYRGAAEVLRANLSGGSNLLKTD